MHSFLALHVLFTISLLDAASTIDQSKFIKQLEKYSYLVKSRGRSIGNSSLTEAIKNLQKDGGLSVTGRMDNKTEELLFAPRCGVVQKKQRGRSFNQPMRPWNIRHLSWKIINYGAVAHQLTFKQILRSVRMALKEWRTVDEFPLQFSYKPKNNDTTLKFAFYKGLHHDGVNYTFDGPGQVLGHAYFPTNGHLHFDAEEKWHTNSIDGQSREGTDFFLVVLHELGHAFGLVHLNDKNAIMYPWYTSHKKLTPADKAAMQAKYRGFTEAPSTTPTTTIDPRRIIELDWDAYICPMSIVASAEANGKAYLFERGTNVYILKKGENLKMNRLNDLFPGLNMTFGYVTAASKDLTGQHVYLFQGDRFTQYKWNEYEKKFNALLTGNLKIKSGTGKPLSFRRKFFAYGLLFMLADDGRTMHLFDWSKMDYNTDKKLAAYFENNAPHYTSATSVFNLFDDVIFHVSTYKFQVYDRNLYYDKNKPVRKFHSLNSLLENYSGHPLNCNRRN